MAPLIRTLLVEVDDVALPTAPPAAVDPATIPPRPRRVAGPLTAELGGYGRYPAWRPTLAVPPPARPRAVTPLLLGDFDGYAMFAASPVGALPFGGAPNPLALDIGPVMIRAGNQQYVTGDGIPYRHGLVYPTFERSIDDGTDIGGRASLSLGDFQLENGDRHWDHLAEQVAIDGRDITVKMPGAAGLETVARFTGRDIVPGTARVRLRARGWDFLLAKPLQPTLYDASYPADIQQRPVPICYGPCENVTPTRIRQTPPTYQVNDVPSRSIGVIFDGGVPLTAADVTARDTTTSVFVLAREPSKAITVNVEGAVIDGVYLNTTALVLRDIVQRRMELGAERISDGHLAQLATDCPGEIQLYVPHGEQPQAAELVDRLLTPFGWSDFSWMGRFIAGIWSVPSGAPKCALTEQAGIIQIEPLDLPTAFAAPPWRVRAGADRNFTVQTVNDLWGDPTSPTDAVGGTERRRWLGRAQDLAVAQSLSARDLLHKAASDPDPWETYFRSTQDAQLMAQAYLSLRLGNRMRYRVLTDTRPFFFELGDVVYLRHSRYGLSGGTLARVCRVKEQWPYTELRVMT